MHFKTTYDLALIAYEPKTINFSVCSLSYWPKPLFQREAKCEAIDLKIVCCSLANKTLLHKKNFVVAIILKVRGFETKLSPNPLALNI